MDQVIVTPEDYLQGPENIGGISTVSRKGGITILGVAAWIRTAQADGEVTLRSKDPMFVDGQVNDYDIWTLGAASSSHANQALECAWHLSPANYRTSPQGSGAELELVTNAGVNDGFITVWGIYGQEPLGGRKAFSGSPVDWNS